MESQSIIDISVLKGDKLFNENTPFIINLSSPQPENTEKRFNADLICVIDISGSMCGEKIELVKQSLKILVEMMEKNDRLALILFNHSSYNFYDLDFMNDENKKDLLSKINEINAKGGTDILSGLEKAVDILKKEKDKTNEDRVSSILLLSDGCDNHLNDIQLADSLRNLTKGLNLSFTLNTFGYGYDHDPKIMNKLANVRDGSFFLVEEYNKVSEYFVSVLGGCVSVVSKKSDLNVQLLNKKCKIVKIFGEKNLFSYELKDEFFKTTMLQFIYGKDYTFVLEIKIDSDVQIGEELLDINFTYEDLNQNNKLITKNIKYKYELTDLKLEKANEEYIRSQVYFILEEALQLREKNEDEKAKKMLANMENWLKNNYKGDNKIFLEDVIKTKNMFEDEEVFRTRGVTYATSQIRQMQSKKIGSTMLYSNMVQMNYSKKAQTKTVPYKHNLFG